MVTEKYLSEWKSIRIVAELWWCGDDVCDCTQPIIDRISPNLKAGYPWIIRERLWEGTFHSGADSSELATQRKELMEAASRFGIGAALPPSFN